MFCYDETAADKLFTRIIGVVRMADLSLDAMQARNDEILLNNFIESNRHFILASAYRAVGHFVTESDDEYSIALMAFHEAVTSYNVTKGIFHSFAALVIKRRLYDYMRSNARFSEEISVDPGAMNDEIEEEHPQKSLQMEIRRKEAELARQNTSVVPGDNPIRDEIEAVQDILVHYGFSFFDLAQCSPRTDKTKKACAEAVAYMLEHESLIRKMRAKRTLPVKELKEGAGISRKILERHRKYIIAAIEILNGEYPLLAE